MVYLGVGRTGGRGRVGISGGGGSKVGGGGGSNSGGGRGSKGGGGGASTGGGGNVKGGGGNGGKTGGGSNGSKGGGGNVKGGGNSGGGRGSKGVPTGGGGNVKGGGGNGGKTGGGSSGPNGGGGNVKGGGSSGGGRGSKGVPTGGGGNVKGGTGSGGGRGSKAGGGKIKGGPSSGAKKGGGSSGTKSGRNTGGGDAYQESGRFSDGYLSLDSIYSGRGASLASAGGGSRVIIPSSNTFSGRDAGGGTRGQVYGGPRYNAGYPYGDGGPYVGSRGFPFGFWPIFIFPHPYYGNGEYGPVSNGSRPGGPMREAQVTLSSWATTNPDPNNSNASASYYIIGDAESLAAITSSLEYDCSATVGSAAPVDTNLVKPEQVVSYYRSGSFALALSSYYNTAQSLANQPTSNETTTAQSTIPDAAIPFGTNMTFLSCLNDTINAQIPILDQSSELSVGDVSSATGMPGSGTGLGQVALLWAILSLIGFV